MSNASYCRFRNTLGDLRDCYEEIFEDLEDEEEQARSRLVRLCRKIVDDVGEDYE